MYTSYTVKVKITVSKTVDIITPSIKQNTYISQHQTFHARETVFVDMVKALKNGG